MNISDAHINEILRLNNPFDKPPFVKAPDIWGEDEFNDLEDLNRHASDRVMKLLEDVRCGQYRSTTLLILSDRGGGKSHLLRRLRRKIKSLKSALFILVNDKLDVNNPENSFQFLLADSLNQLGGYDVSQWQELATEIVNTSIQKTYHPKQIISGFKNYKSTLNNALEKLVSSYIRKTNYIKDPNIIRAILFTLLDQDPRACDAVNWLGGKEISQFAANELRLPTQNQSFTAILEILQIISRHRFLVLCFDELDTDSFNDQGNHLSQVVVAMVKKLSSNIEKGLIVTQMLKGTWNNRVKQFTNEANYGKTMESGIVELRSLDQHLCVEICKLILGKFYQSHSIQPPHHLYPLNESEVIEVAKERPTIRKFLEWCRGRMSEIINGDPPRRSPTEEAFQLEIDYIEKSVVEDSHAIASALFYSFQKLVGQTINNIRIDSLEDKLYGKKRDMHLNFKIIGFDQDKPMRIGVAVLQQNNGRSLGAGLKKLKDYQQFNLTRGCLVRSKSKPIGNAVKINHINPLTQELGGEFVDLKFEEIQPLIALYRIYEKRATDYEISEADIRQFIQHSGEKYQIGHHNLLIQEILSDPSGIAPDTPEEPEIEPSPNPQIRPERFSGDASDFEILPPENTNDQELDQFFSV